MPQRLKILGILSAIISGLLVFGFGCKGLSEAEKAAVKRVDLEWWTVYDNVDAINALVEKYRASRPYFNVTVRQLTEDELYPRLVEQLAEDRGPDIISLNTRWLGKFITKLAPMPAAVRDTTVVVTPGAISGTNTSILTNTLNTVTMLQLDREYVQTVKSDVTRGGKIYGLPLSLDTMALYYNKDLLDRAGIPEPPKNWDEFQIAVKKLTKYDKATGKIIQAGAALGTGNNIPGSDDLLALLFQQSQVEFTDRNGQAVFHWGGGDRNENSRAMNVLNFYTDFANPTRDTYTWNESMNNALDRFINGSVGFLFGYSYHYQIIKARAPQLNLEVLPLLQLTPESPVNIANYSMQTVVAKSKKQNEAWALINYLAHSSATKEYLERSGRPTALRAYISAQKEKTELAPFVSDVLVAKNWYKGNNYPAASKAINDMLHEWLQPVPDPDRAGEYRQNILNRAAARVNGTM